MQRMLLGLACAALIAAASCGSSSPQPLAPGPANPASVLPAVSQLDNLRATSTLFSAFTILSQDGATINGSNELVMDAPVPGFAYVVFDLGVQAPGFSIGSVDFTNASWGGILPAPEVFVGLADYGTGIWRFRQALPDGSPANFAGLPGSVDLLSPTNHSYLAIVTSAVALNFGDDMDIAATAGPGGELPADYVTNLPGMPDEYGENNAIVIRPDFSGGDLITYCPDNNGGALVRFTYNNGTGEITPTVKTMFDAGNAEALAGCHSYRPGYYPDGRLGIGAARRSPNGIREVHELTPNSLDFGFGSFQTAVDSTFLPANFDNPQFDYKMDSAGDPHLLFLGQNGKLNYAFYLFGSYGFDTNGPDILGNISMALSGSDIICAYQVDNGGGDTKVVARKFEQCLPNDPGGIDFGTANDIFVLPGKTPGDATSLMLGLGNSIHVATLVGPGAGTNEQLGFAYSDDGVIAGSWDQLIADDGATTDDRGQMASAGVLDDGTPVIAYHDATNKSLRLAISTVPDGGNVTGAVWDSYRIDTSVLGNTVGLFPALGVIQLAGTDKLVIGYGVQTGASIVMRIIVLDAPPAAT